MTENPTSPSQPTPQDMHWGISYLREDIQDLRNQVDTTHHRIDETNKRIDETNRSLGAQIQAVHHRINETNKRMDTHFIWIMTTLVAITSILIAVIKL